MGGQGCSWWTKSQRTEFILRRHLETPCHVVNLGPVCSAMVLPCRRTWPWHVTASREYGLTWAAPTSSPLSSGSSGSQCTRVTQGSSSCSRMGLWATQGRFWSWCGITPLLPGQPDDPRLPPGNPNQNKVCTGPEGEDSTYISQNALFPGCWVMLFMFAFFFSSFS